VPVVAPLLGHVLGVVGMVAEEEVLWVHAWRVVAVMKHEVIAGEIAIVDQPRCAVSENTLAMRVLESPVGTGSWTSADELPAFTCPALDLAPEAILKGSPNPGAYRVIRVSEAQEALVVRATETASSGRSVT
jgi:hypothetical protein